MIREADKNFRFIIPCYEPFYGKWGELFSAIINHNLSNPDEWYLSQSFISIIKAIAYLDTVTEKY